MLKFLIGPAIVGAGYAAGSYYGADAEQLVHKSPAMTQGAIEQALANISPSGTTFFEGGSPVPYEMKVDASTERKLVVTLFFSGRQGAEADLDFTPMDGGASTLITTRIHADGGVLRPVLAGTGNARLAYAPDWMLNLTFKPVLEKLAEQIEQGDVARIEDTGDPEVRWESNLSDDQRQQLADWRQYDATRPATDPDADAQRQMEGESTNESAGN